MVDKEARLAFVRAMEPVRGRRFLAVRKTKSALARAMGLKVKKFFCEFKIDTGYCVIWAYKEITGGKPLEEFRLMGSNITVDIMMDWPEDLSVNDPDFRACLVVKGPDMRKEDGKAFLGELFIFAKDSGTVLQIKQAVLAMSKAARSPDASCVYGTVTAEGLNLKTADTLRFKLERDEAIMITRACNRISSLEAVIPSIFGEQAMKQDPRAAIHLLSVPPSMGDGDEIDAKTIALSGRALIEALGTLPSRPIPSVVFTSFSAQAEKSRLRVEGVNGGVTHGSFAESEEFSFITINLLRDIGSAEAVHILKDVTRAIKHVVFDLRGSVSLLECVDSLGPLLLEDFQKPNARELSWFVASACSRNRDRIFNKALGGEAGGSSRSVAQSSPSLRPILRPSKASGSSFTEKSVVLREGSIHSSETGSNPGTPVATFVSSSPVRPQVVPSPLRPAPNVEVPFQARPPSNNGLSGQGPFVTPIEEQTPPPTTSTFETVSNGDSVHNDDSNPSLAPTNAAPTDSMIIHPSDYVNIQQEIDALTRLFEFFRERLRDEPTHPNAQLWRQEMAEVEAEITALGPTMFFVSSSSSATPENPKPADEVENHEKQGMETTSANSESEAVLVSSEFVDRAVSLWAESRKEVLSGSSDQLSDSHIVLESTLQDVRSLAQNLDEFPDMTKISKPARQAAIALVGMLEENVSLRLKLLEKDGEAPSFDQFNPHPIHNLVAQTGKTSPKSAQEISPSKTGKTPVNGAETVHVGEEEYEI